MDIAQITRYGSDQSVQLPLGFQFNTDEVCISRFGDTVVLYPKEVARNTMLQSLKEFTPDFMETRNQPLNAEERDWS
jgi:antitoxin VapB